MKKQLTIAALLAIPASSQAAVLADLTLEEWTNDSATGGTSHTATNFTATTILDSNLESVSGSSISGPSATGSHGVGGSGSNLGEINWSRWNDQNYFSILVTPTPGFQVTLENLTLSIARNGTGAPTDLRAWVIPGVYDGTTALTSATADAAVTLTAAGNDIQNGGITTNNPKAFDLSSAAIQNAPFSVVFGVSETDAAVGNLRINDIVLSGETAPAIPEPASSTLLVIAGFALARRRRK
ncbi:PEP-CTERM sorting domain-containing protein [Verrucomicrobiaceae bacterium 227]